MKKDAEINHREIALSDGKPCQVRVLGLFEVRDIPVDWDEVFTYEVMTYTGRKHTIPFPFHEYKVAPPRPDTPKWEAAEGTKAYHDWREYELYQAALVHYQEMDRRVRRYLQAMTERILRDCVSAEEVKRIVTVIDLDRVREAAMTRPVTRDILKEVLSGQFKASFDGGDLIDQLFIDDDSGGGRYATILGWEVELMNSLRMSQAEYSNLDVYDRALRICGAKLPQWNESLEIRKMRQEWRHSDGQPQTSLRV